VRTKRVISSAVAAVGYDAEHRVLEVRFRSGRRYFYLDVPARAYRELIAAESIGTYLNESIKPRYRAVRVREE
jgi:hypothetical protein